MAARASTTLLRARRRARAAGAARARRAGPRGLIFARRRGRLAERRQHRARSTWSSSRSALVVFVGVEGVLFCCLVKYRAQKGRVAAQIHGNTRLEIGWTVGAAVHPRLPHGRDVRDAAEHQEPGAPRDIDANGNPVGRATPPSPRPTRSRRPGGESMNIKVDGQQYVWHYTYPSIGGKRVFAYTDMYVPGRHDGHARHQLRRRPALLVDPAARRQGGRAPGLHEQDLVQGHRAGCLHGPVRRAVRPQPRQHVRRSSRCRSTVEGVVRQAGEDLKAAKADAAKARQALEAQQRGTTTTNQSE